MSSTLPLLVAARRTALAVGFGIVLAGAVAAQAQTPNAVPPAFQTPTTKILAIGHVTPKWTPAVRTTVMPQEVRATVEIYLAGKIDQWYFREDQPGVVFLLNAHDVAEARALIEPLRLGKAGLMDFDYIPLGPLAQLRALIGAP